VIFREVVLAFLGWGEEPTGCTEKEKAACKLQFGEYLEWACKNCEKNKEVKNGRE